MTQIFSGVTHALGGHTVAALWYHFAIMFEALFILTTIDAGTRVGRFMLQELLGHVWPKMGQTSWYPSVILSSLVIVAGWGYRFLSRGYSIPWAASIRSGRSSASQIRCSPSSRSPSPPRSSSRWEPRALRSGVTPAPLAWLVAVTMTAGFEKMFSADPRLGFIAHAASLAGSVDPTAARLIFNDHEPGRHVRVHRRGAPAPRPLAEGVDSGVGAPEAATVSEVPYVATSYAAGD